MDSIKGFGTHMLFGCGHVAYALPRMLKLLGGKFVMVLDREDIENNNLLPYCISEDYVGQSKVGAFHRINEDFQGLKTYTYKLDFDTLPDRRGNHIFLTNNWLLSDSWASRRLAVSKLCEVCQYAHNENKWTNFPSIVRIITIGIDPESVTIICRINTKFYNTDSFRSFKHRLRKQVKEELEFFDDLIETKGSEGLQCSIRNNPLCTLGVPFLVGKFLLEVGNVEGIFMLQESITLEEIPTVEE
jgi:hypothetical protein